MPAEMKLLFCEVEDRVDVNIEAGCGGAGSTKKEFFAMAQAKMVIADWLRTANKKILSQEGGYDVRTH